MNQEVLDKAPLITQEQADAFYAENKAQIQQPLEVVRPNLMNYLRQQAVAKEEERFVGQLMKSAKVTLSLPGVTEPIFAINTLGRPTRGAKEARVTVIEFTDYECPRCGEVQPLIKDVLAAFPDKVRLVVREFPLTRHPFARAAAQAAECALEQGKYWEYSELLFKNQNALDEGHLLQYAAQVGMDKNILAAHLKSGQHDRVVQEDIDEGYQVGVSGTPSFYVNGRRLEDRSLDGFKQAIQRALASPN
ncbi:MAG TPA: thioredoxin domain-containing protein [Tepidisphaeraceae bacterium]|nr:thioredoxin domain-containing protein [Tepidisphaeraceae bacterium]